MLNASYCLGRRLILRQGAPRERPVILLHLLRGSRSSFAPETVVLFAVLPHADRPVFRSSGVQLAVGRELDAPDGTVMTLHHVDLLSLPIVNASPGAGLFAHDELVVLEVYSNTCNPMRESEFLDLLGAVSAAIEDDLFARGDAQDRQAAADVIWRRVLGGQGHKLAGFDLGIKDLLLVVVSCGDIVPSQRLASSGDDSGLLGPDNELDGIRVDLANLVGHLGRNVVCRVLGLVVNRGSNPLVLVVLRFKIPDAQNLLVAAGSQDIGDVERESDGTDDVVVLEDQKHLTGVSVPDLGGEVGGGRGSNLVVGALLSLPGRALVPYEGADPVAGAAMSEDRVAIWRLGQWLYSDNWVRMSFKAWMGMGADVPLQAEIMKYSPSFSRLEKLMWGTGREWPWQVRGKYCRAAPLEAMVIVRRT